MKTNERSAKKNGMPESTPVSTESEQSDENNASTHPHYRQNKSGLSMGKRQSTHKKGEKE